MVEVADCLVHTEHRELGQEELLAQIFIVSKGLQLCDGTAQAYVHTGRLLATPALPFGEG